MQPAEAGYTEGIIEKFSRGLGNIAYSGAEVPLNLGQEIYEKDFLYGFPKGVLKGIAYGAGRLAVGLYEVVTFAAPQEPIIPNFNQS